MRRICSVKREAKVAACSISAVPNRPAFDAQRSHWVQTAFIMRRAYLPPTRIFAVRARRARSTPRSPSALARLRSQNYQELKVECYC